jgi:aromatic-L-amino-acid decarboxylase
MAGRHELPPLSMYTSQEAHSSVEKAAITLGIGQSNIRKIGTDAEFRMNVAELEQTIQEDLNRGNLPFAVVPTIGTTSTSSIDPIPQIATLCEQYKLWLHVDASYGGAAAIDPDMQWVLKGCEHADSLILNPHKWLFTPIDCSVLYTRKPEVLKAAFSLVPEYLRNEQSTGEEVPNLMEYGNALGRRFRSLKLWMVMRYFGHAGLVARIREHNRLAQLLVQWIDESGDFERMAPTHFSLVCFRAHPQGIDDESELEALNEHIMSQINTAGRFFLSHTKLHGLFTIRIAIGNLRTAEQDVRNLWAELQQQLVVTKGKAL